MEKSTSDQEIQQKVETASVTNGNQNHAEIHQLDQEAANTLSSGNGNQHKDQLVNSIKEMVASLEPPLSSNECCIYRIPTCLRKLNEEAYTPQVISIGPFHHGTKSLEPMEKLKLKYFKELLQRIDFNVEILVNDIKLHEERVRDCYAESIELSSDDFVKLILVDGSFLIEFFYGLFQTLQEGCLPPLINPISFEVLMLDLHLLENQLPFFILDRLFRHARVREYPSFTSLAIDIFERINDQKLHPNLEAYEISHFADLARAIFLPSSRKLPPHGRNPTSANHLYTAIQLDEAGVKFKVSSRKCLVDLKFTNRTLEIPCMNLNNSTETIYRNIIALEQCQYPYNSHFTDYIVLMTFLITTPKDVDLLVRKGIISNGLGSSNAVASFLNNLGTNVPYYGINSAYHGLFEALNAFYENRKHIWKATLKRDYFSTPWRIASTAAACILLLLTLGQFICSIIQLKM